jgi:hypothetical protein
MDRYLSELIEIYVFVWALTRRELDIILLIFQRIMIIKAYMCQHFYLKEFSSRVSSCVPFNAVSMVGPTLCFSVFLLALAGLL